MIYNRFGNSGAYKCLLCNKMTRDTGHGEAELEYCKKCLFQCYMVNAGADYGTDSDEYKNAKADYESIK